jgi:hypothetical protein
MCSIENCDKAINRDGVCLRHKLLTVNANVEHLRQERNGTDLTQGRGTRAYVENMYAKRRAQGLPDPLPTTKEAARYAPKVGLTKSRKYKEANNGL